MLSHLRFPFEAGRGRRYPEPDHRYRNPYQRDRDRVIHSRAFRRLEAKTQVFAAGISDHFRNRLTHTIEVSKISRTVADALGLNCDLTEALALVHDIGHPPFAHAGESELNRQMLKFGERFDHNIHALRIVESFERQYARFPGLNLTFEVREGIVKNSKDFEPGEIPELEEYLPGQRPPLEAQLIDLADEIAYDTSDLEDAFSARLFDPATIAEHVPVFREAWETVETQYPGASIRERFLEALRGILDAMVTGLVEGTVITASEAGLRDYRDVRTFPERLARFTPAAAQAASEMKGFLHRFVYGTPALDAGRKAAMGRIATLFETFLRRPDLMPANYAEAAVNDSLPRVVCDYIAGMTDTYFDRVYSSEFVTLESSADRTL
jgi:dGTPase